MKKTLALLLALVLVISLVPTSFAWYGYPSSINLSGNASVYVGDVVKWTASVYPSTANQWIEWKSGYPAVATVDQNGNITAHRAGQAHISAIAANGVKKTITLTVYNHSDTPTEVRTSGISTICVGDTVRWTASVYPSTANQWIEWKSGYPAVATVDQNGNITAHRAGQAHISAIAANGVKKTITLTVYEAPKTPGLDSASSMSQLYLSSCLGQWKLPFRLHLASQAHIQISLSDISYSTNSAYMTYKAYWEGMLGNADAQSSIDQLSYYANYGGITFTQGTTKSGEPALISNRFSIYTIDNIEVAKVTLAIKMDGNLYADYGIYNNFIDICQKV